MPYLQKDRKDIMPYLSSLTFINIQSHKETILPLSEGLNIIKGSSHKGKSALIRGIRLLLFNEPLAPQDKIKSWFSRDNEELSVTAEFSDGSYVIRTHSKSFNGYIVGNEDGEGEFEALRGDVPEEVKKALNLDRINFRGQHDGYFMLSSKSGEVGKLFNQVAGLSVIDFVLGNVNSMSRETSWKLELAKKEVAKAKGKIESLLYAREVEPRIKALERRINRCSALTENLSVMKSVKSSINLQEEIIKRSKEKISFKSKLLLLKSKIEEFKTLNGEYIYLKSIDSTIKREERAHKETSEWLKVKTKAVKLRAKIEEYKTIDEKRKELSNIYNSITSANLLQNSLSERLEQLKEKRKALHKQLNYCPRCGAHKSHWDDKRV